MNVADTQAPQSQAPEFGDMQGLVQYGHGHLQVSRFLVLEVVDARAASRWLDTLEVTTAESVSPRPVHAIHIALSASGLGELGLDTELINEFSSEFVSGISGDPARSRRLGDIDNNVPDSWLWGHGSNEAHALLMLYANPDRIDSLEAQVCDQSFDSGWRIATALPAGLIRTNEAFGFADGISQPLLDWNRRVNADPHGPPHYTNRIAPGEVVLGYADEYGMLAPRPQPEHARYPAATRLPTAPGHASPHGDLGRNGSYLVFRQIEQHIPAFWKFIDEAADGNAEAREALAAAMVGRQRDGVPLAPASDTLIDGISEADRRNGFNYDDDPHGHACPIGAHVRRANPRTGDYPSDVVGTWSRFRRILGFGSRYVADDIISASRFHRLLRRGRSYGTELSVDDALAVTESGMSNTEGRGLHFICLCGSVSRQFEFVQSAWLNASHFGGLEAERDPLLGSRCALAGGRSANGFTRPRATGAADQIDSLPPFTRVLGGGYFFLPGIRALKFIAAAGVT